MPSSLRIKAVAESASPASPPMVMKCQVPEPLPPVRIVDFHCELTSEKNALGLYLDGRVSAVVGTHTHVVTGDERILPQGTA